MIIFLWFALVIEILILQKIITSRLLYFRNHASCIEPTHYLISGQQLAQETGNQKGLISQPVLSVPEGTEKLFEELQLNKMSFVD